MGGLSEALARFLPDRRDFLDRARSVPSINRTTGNRLRQQLIDDVTREPVEPGEKGRGYEVGKNQYLLIEEDELDALTIERTTPLR